MNNIQYKLCVFGDGGVGKSTLVNRYLTGKFSDDFKMTIGVEFYVTELYIEKMKVKLQIWDFGGEERFRKLLPGYVMGSSGGIFMFDISRLSSLVHLTDWMEVLKKRLNDQDQYIPILMVGGKSDLAEMGKRSVERDYALEISKKPEIFDYVECSSKSGENVEKVFFTLVRKMLELSGTI
ncbi:MAG: GTP-binding protein [Candidatus Lokiarchaeota archaeon]|nr:GTP-binding protein [Candidatus Lokiarchaeota archaeon]